MDDIFTVENAKSWVFHNWLSSKWECDPVALLEQRQPLRFLGMEIHVGEDGASFEVSQKGFIEELLRAHGHKGSKSWSMGARDQLLLTPEEEEELLEETPPREGEVDLAELREAQRRVGGLALMASRVRKNIKVVNQIGHRLLDYLCQTANYCLVFGRSEEPDDEVNVFTDSSFAPAGARSHGAAVVTYKGTPICWRSSRQTLVTLSTAESELVEAVEGALLLESVEGVIQEIAGLTPRLTIRVDNMSAMQLLNGSSGRSWRTRHLRLRSSWLKEQVSTGQMRVLHEQGETQLADLGTKPLPRQRLQELVALWRLKDLDRKVRTLTPTAAVKRNRLSWFSY